MGMSKERLHVHNSTPSSFIHNMIVAYVTGYKTGLVAGSSTMAARGVGHLRDDDK